MFSNKLPIINLDINGFAETIDPNQDLHILEGDLITEFIEQPAKYAYYGGLYSDALIVLEQFRNEIKKYEAENELEMRNRIFNRFGEGERLTEAKMAAEFLRDQDWLELDASVREMKKIVNRLEVIKDAFKQRAQMLWSIGATRRQEMVRLNVGQEEQNHE